MPSTKASLKKVPETIPVSLPEKNNTPSRFSRQIPIGGIILVLVVGVLIGAFLAGGGSITGLVGGGIIPSVNSSTGGADSALSGDAPLTYAGVSPGEKGEALKGQFSKAKYQKEVFRPDRENYDLFEKAATYRGETLEQTKAFFYNCCGLTSEADIFAQLPPLPDDFADIAFAIQTGRLFQIGLLEKNIYTQPETYFHGSETAAVNRYWAFKGWAEPDLSQWGDYGGQAMPAHQSASVNKNEQNTFTAVVFFTNGWNIQNYVGINLLPNAESTQYFDVSISEDKTGKPYFLLGPTFPVFDKDWATKVTIEGIVKPETPNGVYTIIINPSRPPKELDGEWSNEHPGLYAPYGGIGPSGGYITLEITVTE